MKDLHTNNKQESFLLISGKFGLKGVKYFSLIFLLFGVVHTLLFGFSLNKFFQIEKTYLEILLLIAIILAGIFFFIIALYLTYKYLIIDGLSIVYRQLEPLIRKVCNLIMDKVDNKSIDSKNNTPIGKIFNTQEIMEDFYGRKVPRPIRWGVKFLLNKIPFLPLLAEVKNARNVQTEEEAREKFYQSIDNYIHRWMFESNSMKWLYWLLPLDIIVQVILIYFLIR